MARPSFSRLAAGTLPIVVALALGFAAGWIVRGERAPPLGLVSELERQVAALEQELAGLSDDEALRLAVPYAYDILGVLDRHLDDLSADMAARSCRGGLALRGDTVRRPERLSLGDCRYGVRSGEPYVTLTLADGRPFHFP